MPKFKLLTALVSITLLLASATLPIFAIEYLPGVTQGQYIKYGNFVGIGPGVESFNDYDWLRLEVTRVSGSEVTLLSTSQFKNGTAIPGNGTTVFWNVQTGTENGVPKTQGPIIAANLNQGDPIPPSGTYTVNKTENQVYLGISRSVNILNATAFTPEYNLTVTYVYDKLSGMLLESISKTTTQGQPEPITSTYSYSIVETNIFSSLPTPIPTIPEFSAQTLTATILIVLAIAISVLTVYQKRKQSSISRI